jgi:hypothetical protein
VHDASRENTIAVMQPYFFPYAGYYRLLAVAQTFVIFDCVQFQRRGRVHRTEVTGPSGQAEWLTLPLAHAPRDVRIADLAFTPGARATFDGRLARLPWLGAARGPLAESVRRHLYGPLESVVDVLAGGLSLVADALHLPAAIVRSSSLSIDAALKGQERVVAIVRALGGNRYINPSGGRALYDSAAFASHGSQLGFLSPYRGPNVRMLEALVSKSVDELRDDILRSSSIEP